jgi:MFS family permease
MIFGIIIYILLGRRQSRKEAEPSTTVTYSDMSASPGRQRRLIVFIILTAFIGAVTMSSIAFIALFLVDSFGVSEETAARSIAIIYSAGLWASPLGGYLSDRLGRVPVILVACFIVGVALYLLNIAPYGIGIWAVLVLIGMTLYVRMPVAEAYIISRTSERHRSTVLGIYYFGGMEGGGVLTPVMGRLIDNFGFYRSFTMAGVAVLVATLVGSVFLWGDRD